MRTDPPPTRHKKLPITKRPIVTVKKNLPTVKAYRRKRMPSDSPPPTPGRKGYYRHNFEDVYNWQSPEWGPRAQANSKMMPKRRKAKKK